jgi:hypothetical protein
MAEIRFSCPDCDQDLEAPEDMAGEVVECPSCEAQLAVPGEAVSAPGAALPGVDDADDGGDVECPSCSQTMAPDAVLCVHCGYNIKLGKKLGTRFD